MLGFNLGSRVTLEAPLLWDGRGQRDRVRTGHVGRHVSDASHLAMNDPGKTRPRVAFDTASVVLRRARRQPAIVVLPLHVTGAAELGLHLHCAASHNRGKKNSGDQHTPSDPTNHSHAIAEGSWACPPPSELALFDFGLGNSPEHAWTIVRFKERGVLANSHMSRLLPTARLSRLANFHSRPACFS